MNVVEDVSVLVALSEKIKRDLNIKFDNLTEELQNESESTKTPINSDSILNEFKIKFELLQNALLESLKHTIGSIQKSNSEYISRGLSSVSTTIKQEVPTADDIISKLDISPFIDDAFSKLSKDIDNKLKDSLPDKELIVEELNLKFNRLNTNILHRLSNIGGGGSVNILDNDDVVYTKVSDITADSVLIFDSVKRKFVPQSMVDIINRIKVDLEMQYDRLIDSNANFTYIGEAAPGTATSDIKWRIKRVEELAGNDINIRWADGTSDLVKSWDNRQLYAYDI